MVGNLRVPSITAVSFVVCRESFIGYSFARSRRGGGVMFTPCVCSMRSFSGNRESNFSLLLVDCRLLLASLFL